MAIPCPCCKASNESGPQCRRCKADLSLLFSIEAERTNWVDAARAALRQGRSNGAMAALDRIEELRQGEDVPPLQAVAFLLNRDFAAALRTYDRAHDRHHSDR